MATKTNQISTLPIQQTLRYVNDEVMQNERFPEEIIDIILNYIFNADMLRDGMVFFGRVTQASSQYNLILLITKITNIRIHPKIPYIIQSIDFDSINIWAALSYSISIGSGSMELINDNKFNKYKIIATEHKYHNLTVGHSLGFGCKYNMLLKYPNMDESIDNDDLIWNNWNEYFDRISLSGRWDWPGHEKTPLPNGYLFCYRINKWLNQINVKQYIGIDVLKKVPSIKKETTTEVAIKQIKNIVENVKLHN
eukprot:543388_1